MSYLYVLLVTYLCCYGVYSNAAGGMEEEEEEWAVRIPGGEKQAREVAEEYGYRMVRKMRTAPDTYILQSARRQRRSVGISDEEHEHRLARDARVQYAARQIGLERSKRNDLYSESRATRLERAAAREIAATTGKLKDPLLEKEWFMRDHKTSHGIRECWRQNLTGKGVVVSVPDDGLERDHPDISINYDPGASLDLNDDDDDPYPRYEETNENKHGTRCAGVISMVANNNICGTGIAFDARVGGVRILDGKVTDRLESEAFGLNPEHVDIYSISWGPTDNGRLVAGPPHLALQGIMRGISQGRGGKGALYSWASGDGGHKGDSCWADGYQNLIQTIGVSSASVKGLVPFYGEKCASTLTTTYSSDHRDEPMIPSADLHHECTNEHSGTSASAPMAAGMLALLLERNPDLTWRDVQHIVAYTSKMEPLADERGWYKNAAGFCVNLGFGHGLMNAAAMVALGDPATWTHIPAQRVCRLTPDQQNKLPVNLSSGNSVTLTFSTDRCKGQGSEIRSLEHVAVEFTLSYTRRGALQAVLTTAQGTETPLIIHRPNDNSTDGLNKWLVSSTHAWGEAPQGEWTLTISDPSTRHEHGAVKAVRLLLYGTRDSPVYMRTEGPKRCDAPRKPTDSIKKPNGSYKTSGIDHRPRSGRII